MPDDTTADTWMLGVIATAMMPQDVKKRRFRKTKKKYQKNFPAQNNMLGKLHRDQQNMGHTHLAHLLKTVLMTIVDMRKLCVHIFTVCCNGCHNIARPGLRSACASYA